MEEEAPERKAAEGKKVVKKKKKVPGKTGSPEDEDEALAPGEKEIPSVTADDDGKKGGLRKPVTIVKEATPEPALRKNSLEPPSGGSRRGSGSNLLSFTPPGGSRRGSITLIADEVRCSLVFPLNSKTIAVA